MLIRSTVFHSSNCPGSLRETDLFTHCRKCAVINYHCYEPKFVPDSDRSRGGSEAWGGVSIQKTSVQGSWGVRAQTPIVHPHWQPQHPGINDHDPYRRSRGHSLHFKGILTGWRVSIRMKDS